ncbi:MAG TPA: ribonuclease R, partial [Hyphomonadaceae bacterium]|nr:ribonuclease R [Hyphomonadaceae bacterium]
PADARDHDDAVFAQADDDPKNKGGWKIIVAIADVSAYVPFNGILDKEAYRRANSTYFPDRVASMLPKALSAGECSLKEGELRCCLAFEMVFSAEGTKLRHRLIRGMMRSAAGLSYEEAQAAIDGEPSDRAAPLLETVLKPLWAAYA